MRRSTLHPALRSLALALAALLAAHATYAAGSDISLPPEGQSAATTLALLDYNRRLCDGVTGKVLNTWRSLGDGPRAEQRIRDVVVERELADLAAGRAASDIVRSFLPRARAEAGTETAASLERLHQLIEELCDTVAWPTAPRGRFATGVRDLLDRIDREQEELGRLLVVPEDALEDALEPYLTAIQLAGVEAENEYLDHLESLKPKPRGPTLEELMQAWHGRYSEAVGPTKQALGQFLQARAANDSRAISQACREILAAVIPVLRDDQLFKLPTPQIPASKGITMETYAPLRQAYEEIRQLAFDCNAGRQREAHADLAEMERQLQIAAAHLGKFSLAP